MFFYISHTEKSVESDDLTFSVSCGVLTFGISRFIFVPTVSGSLWLTGPSTGHWAGRFVLLRGYFCIYCADKATFLSKKWSLPWTKHRVGENRKMQLLKGKLSYKDQRCVEKLIRKAQGGCSQKWCGQEEPGTSLVCSLEVSDVCLGKVPASPHLWCQHEQV